jgi:hypothetical protein
MVYRNELDALAARKEALDREVAERTHERDQAAQLLAQMRSEAEARGKRPSPWWRPLAIGAIGPAIIVTMMLARPSRERHHRFADVDEPLFTSTPVECQRVRLELLVEREEEGFESKELDLDMQKIIAEWNDLTDERKVGQATFCHVMAAIYRDAANVRAKARGQALVSFFGLD